MKPMKRAGLGVMALAGATLLAGCSMFTTTTDGVTSTVKGITGVTSSSTPGSSAAPFVEARFEAIRTEAARGEGEHLDSLATLLGEPNRDEFARWMHGNYERLFSGVQKPQELLARIEQYRGPRG